MFLRLLFLLLLICRITFGQVHSAFFKPLNENSFTKFAGFKIEPADFKETFIHHWHQPSKPTLQLYQIKKNEYITEAVFLHARRLSFRKSINDFKDRFHKISRKTQRQLNLNSLETLIAGPNNDPGSGTHTISYKLLKSNYTVDGQQLNYSIYYKVYDADDTSKVTYTFINGQMEPHPSNKRSYLRKIYAVRKPQYDTTDLRMNSNEFFTKVKPHSKIIPYNAFEAAYEEGVCGLNFNSFPSGFLSDAGGEPVLFESFFGNYSGFSIGYYTKRNLMLKFRFTDNNYDDSPKNKKGLKISSASEIYELTGSTILNPKDRHQIYVSIGAMMAYATRVKINYDNQNNYNSQTGVYTIVDSLPSQTYIFNYKPAFSHVLNIGYRPAIAKYWFSVNFHMATGLFYYKLDNVVEETNFNQIVALPSVYSGLGNLKITHSQIGISIVYRFY